MEKIIITEISVDKFTKPNDKGICTKFWGVKLQDGRGATIWDEVIANNVRNNLNVECEAEIKTQGSFSNIRAFNATNTMTSDHESLKETQSPENQQIDDRNNNLMSPKDRSIVAQCLTKIEFRNTPMAKPLDILESYRFYVREL